MYLRLAWGWEGAFEGGMPPCHSTRETALFEFMASAFASARTCKHLDGRTTSTEFERRNVA